MREVAATEASRNFSAVLDAAERGETIVVTRGGAPIATIAPAPRANGGALSDLFSRHAARSAGAGGDELAENVRSVRDIARSDHDRDPWRD